MENLNVLIRLAKSRLENRPLDPESLPEYHQDEKQNAFAKLIKSKVAPDTWHSMFLFTKKLWVQGGPALSMDILTDDKRVSVTLRPIESGFELDGPAGVVKLADDDQFNDRLLVAVGEALDSTPANY